MGKREQFIRTLLLAAGSLGCDWDWTGVPLENALGEALKWTRTNRPVHKRRRDDFDAWLSIHDTMECMAPAGGSSDEPRAASRRCTA